MALVLTTVTPDLRLTPFTGLSETDRERSGIARAEAVYSSYGLWPATGVGDSRAISFNVELNPDYGYVLMEASAAFIVYAAHNKQEAVGMMEITTDLGPGASQKESQYYPFVNVPARQDAVGSNAVGSILADNYNSQYPVSGSNSIMIYNLNPKPSALLYPFPGVSTIDIASIFSESATEEVVKAYRFYLRFLQYDITQGYNYVVQSPSLTR
jgi:hypothetical protein